MTHDFRLFSFIKESSFQKAAFKKKVVLLRDYEEHIFETVNWRGRARLLQDEWDR
jgi:hypothetical protein